ncbi:superoxide dismutase [Parabacteroides sp. TM07-1AC]|uniref:superoxide dismutase n=1 Tax=Parabacteroides sp. TM07-1AC TaxID=2292363 RepID=UPI000F000FE6|nr:superoxide dismutase [Parabacteroides sp. TM07-1AC]RHU23703.1 superoxide dismutase [Parabacteroides sp. TM07-1AC]
MLTLCLSLLLLVTNNSNNSNNSSSQITDKKEEIMKFELIKLPYAADALEPVISKATIEFHHGKHLQAYVNNLNNLIPGTKFENAPLEQIVAESDGAIFNNAGQILNHNLYFTQFSPNGGGEPKGKLADAIKATWGSFEDFKKEFNAAGAGLFGSGWVWLAKDKDGKLSITKEANGSNPVAKGLTPILGFDVWEHAYYLDYQNRRPDHLNALWQIVDWDAVGKRY